MKRHKRRQCRLHFLSWIFAGALSFGMVPYVGLGVSLACDASTHLVAGGFEPQEAGGKAKRSDDVVQIQVASAKADEERHAIIMLTLTIDPGWHLYANPVAKDFPGIPTTVSVTSGANPEDVKIEYPPGRLVKDEFAGDHYVYEGRIAIRVTMPKDRPAQRPVDLSVKVQACNKDKCLLPATVKVSVP
jgi:DsbC/DsbD-like thiol-disulfide interchange protein